MNLPPVSHSSPERGPQPVARKNNPARTQVEIPAVYDSPGRQDEGTLAEYLHALWRRKLSIGLVVAVFGAAALLISLRERPMYSARTSLEVLELNENFLNRKEVDPNSVPNMTSTEAYMQTQVRLLQSASLVTSVVQKLGLDRDPAYQHPKDRWAWLPAFLRPQANGAETPLARAVTDCRSHLQVDAPGDSRILDVNFEWPKADVAAVFVNTLVDQYVDQSMQASWQTAQRTGTWLTKQLQETKQKLERSEAHLQDYARSQGLLYTNEKENVTEDKLRQVQQDLGKAQADRMAAEAQYDLLNTAPPESLPKILDDGTLREYQVRLTELRRQYSELNVTLTPAHEKVQRVQAQIAALETALRKAQQDLVNRIRNEFMAAEAKEKMLQQSYDRQAKVVSDQAAKNAQYDLLRHEVDATRQMYEGMLEKVQQAGVASTIGANNLRVIDYASPPQEPFKPKTPLNVAMGMVAGLFLALTFVSIRYHTAKGSRVSKDLSTRLGVPELGIIPSAKADRHLRLRRSRVELAASARSSMLAASFQSTLLSILYSSGGNQKGSVLAVTSPSKGEGKTTIASNLAIALAELNPGVLLVDGDLRNPRLHEIFSLENRAGLAELVTEAGPMNDGAWREKVQCTHVPGLSVLTAGCVSDLSLSQGFYSNRLDKVLEHLRTQFSAIVIDTPPILLFPDARILAKQADGVAFVVRANRTNLEWANAAHQRLRQDGVTLLGVIVNDYTREGGSDPYAASNYYRSSGTFR